MTSQPTILVAAEPGEVQVFTLAQFCGRNAISVCGFHKLRREGRAPRIMRVGNRILITRQAEIDWHVSREYPDDTEARLLAREDEARRASARKAAKVSAEVRASKRKKRA